MAFYRVFMTSITHVIVHSLVVEVLTHRGWKATIDEDMQALRANGTCDLVLTPVGKSIVGWHWVYNVKVLLDGTMKYLKA